MMGDFFGLGCAARGLVRVGQKHDRGEGLSATGTARTSGFWHFALSGPHIQNVASLKYMTYILPVNGSRGTSYSLVPLTHRTSDSTLVPTSVEACRKESYLPDMLRQTPKSANMPCKCLKVTANDAYSESDVLRTLPCDYLPYLPTLGYCVLSTDQYHDFFKPKVQT
ncbi:hypothetical protein CONLIGDRAFT_640817 [Coniochaeta ligniaria NRRL 30616]|uniref:Uncharacterized protein n=1 Tax=Coniochaeta ligniaria NRRL 30616 TaxID=1408157 RepID=A0A1J7J0Z9_9PEZI|nr:hypothetical protein CONLIGDRAFT_640817 [Coniochaeta ligniaria NRRL 30616]